MENKPPLGLQPRYVFDENTNKKRIHEISKAMKRYSDADKPMPKEWVDELCLRMPQLLGA